MGFTWPILHDGPQFHVLITALPPGNQVKHMHTVGRLSVLFAFLTRQLYLENGKHGQSILLVLQTNQACYTETQSGEFSFKQNKKLTVKVDLASQRRNAYQSCSAHAEQWRHGLIEELGVHICCVM